MKTIPLSDLSLLEKWLTRLGSDQDGEAANAGRQATAILTKHGFTWSELLRKQVQVDIEPAAEPSREAIIAVTNAKVQRALDTLRGVDLGNFSHYITSLDAKWAKDNYLTQPQREALFKAYDRYLKEQR